MCPVPQSRLVGVGISIFLYFLDTPSSGSHYKSFIWGALAAPCYNTCMNNLVSQLINKGENAEDEYDSVFEQIASWTAFQIELCSRTKVPLYLETNTGSPPKWRGKDLSHMKEEDKTSEKVQTKWRQAIYQIQSSKHFIRMLNEKNKKCSMNLRVE